MPTAPKALRELSIRNPVNPDWFDSYFDLVIAFLLPLLTALAGMWLFRFLFPALSGQMPLLEQLACGLGLGMMAVAAFTLGIKLCGFHGARSDSPVDRRGRHCGNLAQPQSLFDRDC